MLTHIITQGLLALFVCVISRYLGFSDMQIWGCAALCATGMGLCLGLAERDPVDAFLEDFRHE